MRLRRDGTTDDGIDCLVFTEREGLLSAVGHDLKLRVGTWELTIEGDAVTARFDAGSLRVVAAQRDGRDAPGLISAGDIRSIERACADDILEARRHPAILFQAKVTRATDDRAILDGTLTLKGVTRPLQLAAHRDSDGWSVSTELHQPSFGITPYRAFFGALKLKPEVRVTVRVPRSAG